MTINYLCVIFQSRYLYIYERQQSVRDEEATHPDYIPGVSPFLFLMIGGAGRGESAGAGTDNRSI